MRKSNADEMKIENLYASKVVAAACWFVYAAAYIGRVTYAAAAAGMADSGFPKSDIGLIGTAFFLCYGCGQLLNGYLGDLVSPFKMIFFGMVGSTLANFGMSFCGTAAQMTAVWGLNGLAQSMLWSPIIRIYASVINEKIRDKWCLYLTTSVPAGTLSAYGIAALALKHSGWETIYSVSGAVLLASVGVWAFVWKYSSKHTAYVQKPKQDVILKNGLDSGGGALRLIMMSGGAMILLSTAIHGMLKEGISSWVPTMISESYNMSASFSVFITIVLPIINLAGPYIVAPLYKKYLGRNEVLAAGLCLAAAAVPLCALVFVGKIPVFICVVLFAVTTSIMHAYNYLIITMAPIRFAPFGKASFATGLFNSITYLGCAVATYGMGFVAERYSWSISVAVCIGLSLMGFGCCLPIIRRWKRFTDSETNK